MQHVTRTFPVNSYLHCIGKHSSGDCQWCAGKRETITHFQTECDEFVGARHAAHNLIWQTILAGLEEFAAPGWKFYREVPFSELPFEFEWADLEEFVKEGERQPDGVAWHAATKKLYLLEFTRAMDHSHNLKDAQDRKGQQYLAAMKAFRLHQRRNRTWSERATIATLPFIYGVRGSVLEKECSAHLTTLGVLKHAHRQTILTRGVHAAVQGLYNMKLARTAAMEVWLSKQQAAQAAAAVRKRKKKDPRAGKKSKKATPARTHKGTAGA